MKDQLIHHFQKQPQTVEERLAAGKALREQFSRLDQGNYTPAPDRADPISIMEAQARTRLPELVPIRHARMLNSSFAFLRGGAAVMAADLAANPGTSGIKVQACGDMHLANFGVFASAERNLVFGINDFDETLPGPWEWDLKRLVASIVVSGRFLGADSDLCVEAVMEAVSSYRKRMAEYAYYGNLELWYATLNEKAILKTLGPDQKKAFGKLTSKARTRTHMQVLGKLTDMIDKKFRLRDDAPFLVHETHTKIGRPINEALALFLDSYVPTLTDDRKKLLKHYRIVDVARKVVGVGSVGTRCWVIFLMGNNSDDPLFLQLKEAQPSVLEPFLEDSVYKHQGQRVVAGQRLIQGAPDIFLGWGEQDGFQYYIRQLRDMKGGVDFNPETTDMKNFVPYCGLCAWAMALAHAKSGDAAMISGYAGKSEVLDEAMVRFALEYADQNEKDYKALKAAARSGRIAVGQSG